MTSARIFFYGGPADGLSAPAGTLPDEFVWHAYGDALALSKNPEHLGSIHLTEHVYRRNVHRQTRCQTYSYVGTRPTSSLERRGTP